MRPLPSCEQQTHEPSKLRNRQMRATYSFPQSQPLVATREWDHWSSVGQQESNDAGIVLVSSIRNTMRVWDGALELELGA